MKILLIRTAPLPLCDWAVEKLAAEFPSDKIDVLTRSDSAAHFERNPHVWKVFRYPGEFFDYHKARETVLPQLEAEKYESVAFIYNTPEKEGFFHIHVMARHLKPRSVVAFDLERNMNIESLSGFHAGRWCGIIIRKLILVPFLSVAAAIMKAFCALKGTHPET